MADCFLRGWHLAEQPSAWEATQNFCLLLTPGPSQLVQLWSIGPELQTQRSKALTFSPGPGSNQWSSHPLGCALSKETSFLDVSLSWLCEFLTQFLSLTFHFRQMELVMGIKSHCKMMNKMRDYRDSELLLDTKPAILASVLPQYRICPFPSSANFLSQGPERQGLVG